MGGRFLKQRGGYGLSEGETEALENSCWSKAQGGSCGGITQIPSGPRRPQTGAALRERRAHAAVLTATLPWKPGPQPWARTHG